MGSLHISKSVVWNQFLFISSAMPYICALHTIDAPLKAVDPLHDQDHDQSLSNLSFDFNNQYLLILFLFKCVYKLGFILEVKIVKKYQGKINLDNWS